MLKPAVLTDESKKDRTEENKFPVRPLILLPSEVEFLLSYLAKGDDDNKDVINYDNEEDRRLLEDNDDYNVSEIKSCIYLCTFIYIHKYILMYLYMMLYICLYIMLYIFVYMYMYICL
jgi:hypothetical protein